MIEMTFNDLFIQELEFVLDHFRGVDNWSRQTMFVDFIFDAKVSSGEDEEKGRYNSRLLIAEYKPGVGLSEEDENFEESGNKVFTIDSRIYESNEQPDYIVERFYGS